MTREILSKEEIVRLLESGKVLEIYVRRRFNDKYECEVTWNPHADELSEWVIDVWNCHGVLKRRAWGVGYGAVPQQDCEYVDIGYFSIPVRKGSKLSEEEAKRLEEALSEVVWRHGAINMSGFYPVLKEDLAKIKEIIRNKLFEEKKGDEL